RVPWHPRQLLEARSSGDLPAGAAIAQEIVGLVDPIFSGVRRWAPLDFLNRTDELGREDPEELLSRLYHKGLQPQLELASMKILSAEPASVVFAGGIDAA